MKSLAIFGLFLPAVLAQGGESYGCGNDTVYLPGSTSTVTLVLDSTADAAGVTSPATSAVSIVGSGSTATDDVFYYVVRNGTTSWIGSAPSSQDFQGTTTITATVTVESNTSDEASPVFTNDFTGNTTSEEPTTTIQRTSFITDFVTVISVGSNSSATVNGTSEVDAAGVTGSSSTQSVAVDAEGNTLISETSAQSNSSAIFVATTLTADSTDTNDAMDTEEAMDAEELTDMEVTDTDEEATDIEEEAAGTTSDESAEADGLDISSTTLETSLMTAYGNMAAEETTTDSFTTSCSPSVFPGFTSGSVTSPSSTLLICVITTADGAMPMATDTDDTDSEAVTTSTIVPFANSTLIATTNPPDSVSETSDMAGAESMTADGAFANQTFTDTSMMASSTDVEPASTVGDAESTATGCGEWGNFTLSWDDEPVFTPEDNATAPYPPVFNPYHNLFFSNGYAYIPPPNSPYKASTGSRFAIFLTEEVRQDNGSMQMGGAEPGEIGAGPRMAIDAFWFNAYEADLGCDNEGPNSCFMRISGYQWDERRQNDVMATQQIAIIPPCNQTAGCELTPVTFEDTFRQLTAIKIEAYAGGSARNWYMDDLSLGWWNNTCAAGLRRLESRL